MGRRRKIIEHTRKVSLNKHQHDYTRWQDIQRFFKKAGTGYEQEIHLEGDSRVVKPSFHMQTFNPKNKKPIDSEDPVEKFWAAKVDWDNDRLHLDPAPLMVNSNCWATFLTRSIEF